MIIIKLKFNRSNRSSIINISYNKNLQSNYSYKTYKSKNINSPRQRKVRRWKQLKKAKEKEGMEFISVFFKIVKEYMHLEIP